LSLFSLTHTEILFFIFPWIKKKFAVQVDGEISCLEKNKKKLNKLQTKKKPHRNIFPSPSLSLVPTMFPVARSSNNATIVFYRPEVLAEVAAAATYQMMIGATPLVCRSFQEASTHVRELSAESALVIFGSYYSLAQIEELVAMCSFCLRKVIVYMYESDVAARNMVSPPPLSTNPLDVQIVYHKVDSTKCSYAAFTWNAFCADALDPKIMPVALQLIDNKGRNDLTSDARTKPFCEWLQTQRATLELVGKVISQDNAEALVEQVRAGQAYLEKTDSVVAAIASSAGWYTSATGKQSIQVAVVDAQRLIDGVADYLCTVGRSEGGCAGLAVITRFDHVANKSRYTFYTNRPSDQVNAVALARNMGYDAGGSARMAGFVSDDTIPQFLAKLASKK